MCHCPCGCAHCGCRPRVPVRHPHDHRWPQPCGHVFPWYSVVPPTHCPLCGAPLFQTPHYFPPVYTITSDTTVTVINNVGAMS